MALGGEGGGRDQVGRRPQPTERDAAQHRFGVPPHTVPHAPRTRGLSIRFESRFQLLSDHPKNGLALWRTIA